MSDSNERAVVDCVLRYVYNTPPRTVIDAVYSADAADTYKSEKTNTLIERGIMFFWGCLDEAHQMRLVSAAICKYGYECGVITSTCDS